MGERILVVDDNSVSAEILCTCLTGLGAETIVCENGQECLARIAQGKVSMVFTEVVSAGISGLDVLMAIRQAHDLLELPVIMMTSHRDDNLMAKAFGLGANDFLCKPVKSQVVISKIYNHIQALELYKRSLKNKGREIVHSMVATYNHEINNALSVAYAELYLARMDDDNPALGRISDALKLVCSVTEKIKALGASDIEQTGYLFGEKMIRLGKESDA